MNVIVKDPDEKPKKEQKKKKKAKAKSKQKRTRKQRTAKESTALILGIAAIFLAVLGVASLIWLSQVVAIVLGGCAIVGGFASLFVGKGGILPAVVALVAGFMTILSAMVSMQLG